MRSNSTANPTKFMKEVIEDDEAKRGVAKPGVASGAVCDDRMGGAAKKLPKGRRP